MSRPPSPDPLRCSGCGRCVAACRERAYSLEPRGYRKEAVRREDIPCTECLSCLDSCPVSAIRHPSR